MKTYYAEKLLENIKQAIFQNYLTYNCVNDVYSEFIYRFVEAINVIAPAKSIRIKANWKPFLDNQFISVIQRLDKLFRKLKNPGLETNKKNFKVEDNFEVALQEMIIKKKTILWKRTS